jgi:hypothetical protein
MPDNQLSIFPLKIGSERRHLVDQNDQPFLVHGDTAWSIITALTKAEAEHYLANRAAKGFNALIRTPARAMRLSPTWVTCLPQTRNTGNMPTGC